jgi:cytochrome b subunit of formate dehydrogenase
MGETAASLYRRIAVALTATLVLLVAGVFLFPDALPIFPAIVVPIWLVFFPGNRQYDAGARRVLWFALAAGVLLFLAGVVVLILAS